MNSSLGVIDHSNSTTTCFCVADPPTPCWADVEEGPATARFFFGAVYEKDHGCEANTTHETGLCPKHREEILGAE